MAELLQDGVHPCPVAEHECRTCKTTKPCSEFYRKTLTSGATGVHKECKVCCRKRANDWYWANRERASARQKVYNRENRAKITERNRIVKYGLRPGEYDQMLKHQQGRCAICKKKRKLYVDHCHTSKKPRGLLCTRCNSAIGYFEEDVILLAAAIRYIKKYQHLKDTSLPR